MMNKAKSADKKASQFERRMHKKAARKAGEQPSFGGKNRRLPSDMSGPSAMRKGGVVKKKK